MRMMKRWGETRTWLAALAMMAGSAAWAPGAWASDGVLEINHTCATQSGCLSGDTTCP